MAVGFADPSWWRRLPPALGRVVGMEWWTFPRTVPRFEAPPALGDGWPVARPEASGLDPVGLRQVLDAVAGREYGAVTALLVSHRGQLVIEEYYQGHTRERLHPVQSVTKSFLSVLMGVASDQGLLALEDPLGEVLPSRSSSLGADPAKSAITVRDLLAMRAGIEWDEWACSYLDVSCNSNAQMNRTEDWVGFVLGLPMAIDPGARFIYNTGASVVLGAVLQDQTASDPATMQTSSSSAPYRSKGSPGCGTSPIRRGCPTQEEVFT